MDEYLNEIIFGIEINSYNRFPYFMSKANTLSDKQYWQGLKQAYQSSDNLFPWKKLVQAAFSVNRGGNQFLMSPYERKKYKSLPNEIRIYRGMTIQELESKDFGYSWSLKERIAFFFASTYQRNHNTRGLSTTVQSRVVKKNEIQALFTYESEVIYFDNPIDNAEEIINNHIKVYKHNPHEGNQYYGISLNDFILEDRDTGKVYRVVNGVKKEF